MKSKIISRTPISTFSFSPSSISISNKARRGCSILKVIGIAALSIFILLDVTGASPFAYVTNYDNNNVSVINTSSENVVASVNVGSGPRGIAVSPDGTRAYVANSCSNDVYVIDTIKNKVIDIAHVGSYPQGIAVSPDGTKVYVGNSASNTISVIDTATNNVTATVKIGNLPYRVAVAPDGKKVYTVISGESPNYQGTVYVIDTATNTVTATLNVERNPRGIAVSPDGTKVYVVNSDGYPYYNGTVSVIDTATNTITSTVNVGNLPQGIAVSPDGTRIYVAIENPGGYSDADNIGVTSHTGTVDVIDTTTNKVIDTVGVGSTPHEVAVTPDGNEVYVVNEENNTVSVIDTATNKVNNTVHVGRGPVAVEIGQVAKSSSTIKSNGTSFLNPVNQTENKTNDTGMTVNAGTAGKQEIESVPTQALIPFLSPIWVLVAVLGTVAFIRKVK